MDSDVATCAPSAAVNVLHIHGTSDATILYDGGSLFDNLYTSAATSVKRWAQIDKCLTSPQIGAAFDLIGTLDGAETTPTIYSCPRTTVELWSIDGGAHSPDIDESSALKIVDWFLAHPKK
jgi:polyhydroxybutyrate depolymerase